MTLRISGKRRLKTLTGLNTRPTSSRVRQVVFDIFQNELEDSSWLDVCSGSGSIGAEALCRGASFVVGIELSRSACKIIEENWSKIAKEGQKTRVIKGDARIVLSRNSTPLSPFDFIYFDPPYKSDLYETLLPILPNFLKDTGTLIVEHFKTKILPEQLAATSRTDQRFYGQTGLTFYS